MIIIKDNSGKVLFIGEIKEGQEFLKVKLRLEKEARDKEMSEWAAATFIALLFVFAVCVLYQLATS